MFCCFFQVPYYSKMLVQRNDNTLHSFLAFSTISQRKRHCEVCKSSNMYSQLHPAGNKVDTLFWMIFTDFQYKVFSSELKPNMNQNLVFYRSKYKLAHCTSKTIPILKIKDLVCMLRFIKQHAFFTHSVDAWYEAPFVSLFCILNICSTL